MNKTRRIMSVMLGCILSISMLGCEKKTGLPGNANMFIRIDDYHAADLSKNSALDIVRYGEPPGVNMVGTSRDKGIVYFNGGTWRAFNVPKSSDVYIYFHINTENTLLNLDSHAASVNLKDNKWVIFFYRSNGYGWDDTSGSYDLVEE